MPGGGPRDPGSRPITERSGCAARSICRALGHDTFVAARADGRRRRRLAAPSPTRTDPGNHSEQCSPHQSLSRSTVHRCQETPSISRRRRRHYCTIGLHAPRRGGHRAALIGWARPQWGGTHAPTNGRTWCCGDLHSDRRVRQHKRQRRVDEPPPDR
jgi:hypothetical protein